LTAPEVEVAIVGAGVVGCAAALALARRGVAVALLEAEPEAGLGASGTNSGILHTGFDSVPGELETELILASGGLRDPVLTGLEVPVLRCGAVMRAFDDSQRGAVATLAAGAQRNGVTTVLSGDGGALEIPGEAVTDPVLSVRVALDNAEPDDGVVDRRQRLVEPRVVAGDLGRDVDQREAPVLVLELDVIAVLGAHLRSFLWVSARRSAR
jgi:glycerol-3-phosphate dehydrogenase